MKPHKAYSLTYVFGHDGRLRNSCMTVLTLLEDAGGGVSLAPHAFGVFTYDRCEGETIVLTMSDTPIVPLFDFADLLARIREGTLVPQSALLKVGRVDWFSVGRPEHEGYLLGALQTLSLKAERDKKMLWHYAVTSKQSAH